MRQVNTTAIERVREYRGSVRVTDNGRSEIVRTWLNAGIELFAAGEKLDLLIASSTHGERAYKLALPTVTRTQLIVDRATLERHLTVLFDDVRPLNADFDTPLDLIRTVRAGKSVPDSEKSWVDHSKLDERLLLTYKQGWRQASYGLPAAQWALSIFNRESI